MVTIGFPRGRSAVVAGLTVLALAASACSSGSDGDSSDASTPGAATSGAATSDGTASPLTTPAVSTPPVTTPPVTAAPTSDVADAGGGATDAVCGGITAAEVGAAVGAGDFDSADDLSVDTETTCLFTNSASVYGVSISSEPTVSYLAGELSALTPDEALGRLELVLTAPMLEGATVARVPVGDGQALVATGVDSILGTAKGAGAVVVDGRVVLIDVGGAELAADPAGFAPIVTNLLALAADS